MRARGVTNLNQVLYLDDVNVTLGGPIKRDRLWFFSATRFASNKNQVQGIYFNTTQGTPFYTPDLNQPAYRECVDQEHGRPLTWQATSKQKLSGFVDFQTVSGAGRGGLQGVGVANAMEILAG